MVQGSLLLGQQDNFGGMGKEEREKIAAFTPRAQYIYSAFAIINV